MNWDQIEGQLKQVSGLVKEKWAKLTDDDLLLLAGKKEVARVRCGDCGHELLVAFSCKGRGVCPSCTSRRAHDVAAHLVDRVLPRVPVRQWVFTFPKRVRWHLASDPKLTSEVLDLCLRAVFSFQRKRARQTGIRKPLPGSVSFVQNFGSALNANTHIHAILPDGVFHEPDCAAPDAPLAFHELPWPLDVDVEALLLRISTRVVKLLQRRGRLDDDTGPDDALGALQAESIASRLPPAPDEADPPRRSRRSAFLEGFSLHANTHLHEHDREGLERLCVYGARGPLSLARLTELPDGRLSYFMKRKGPNGRTHLVLTPAELLRKLSALVPRPRVHLTRYHGVFAPNAAARHRVVPALPPPPAPPPAELQDLPPPLVPLPPVLPVRQRVPWADLLKRTFGLDVLQCPRCDGRLRVLAYLTDPDITAGILDHLGLPSSPPPLAPARERPQLDLLG